MMMKIVCVAFISIALVQANPISDRLPVDLDFKNDASFEVGAKNNNGNSNQGKAILSYDEAGENPEDDNVSENLDDLGLDVSANDNIKENGVGANENGNGNDNEFPIEYNDSKPEVNNRFPTFEESENGHAAGSSNGGATNGNSDEFPINYDRPEQDTNSGNIQEENHKDDVGQGNGGGAGIDFEVGGHGDKDKHGLGNLGGIFSKVGDAFRDTVDESKGKVGEGIESAVGSGKQIFDTGKKLADAGISVGGAFPRFGKKLFDAFGKSDNVGEVQQSHSWRL